MIDSTFTTETFGNTVAQWGYRDDGDMGLLYIGARWYDPAVGRWTSADKWLGDIYRPLSLNRYLYCEDDPVNLVDPSGYLPKWQDVKDWITEHGKTIAKGVGTVVGVITGIKIAEEIYIVYVDWDTSRRVNDMIRTWQPHNPDSVNWDLINQLRNQHIRDAMRDIGRAGGDIAKQIYGRVRPSR